MGLHKQASLKHKIKQSRETSDKKKKKKNCPTNNDTCRFFYFPSQ